jgi:hypothetical protein
LAALSLKLAILPRLAHIDRQAIYMEYVDGQEGLTEHNARQAGKVLRLLHEQRDYPPPGMNGLTWLIQMANLNPVRLDDSQIIMAEIEFDSLRAVCRI